MNKAFVLLNVKSGYEDSIKDTLKKTRGVIISHAIYGKYDFMITMESSTQDELKTDIFALRKMTGVTSTLSMIVIE
jgi:hypothetical protein|tara:strand:- start:398 stop:625 length:228 start_codon:yes stop_codon:yes gene_type:complete